MTGPRFLASALASLALGACVRDVGIGPRLGACADVPDAAYTYGQAGIGTCLAGPVDMAFVATAAGPRLAVVNSDPFRGFASGSLLVLDGEAVGEAEGVVPVDRLATGALPLDRFGGRMARLPDSALGPRLLVPTRLSEGSYFRRTPDRAWVVDLVDPDRPAFGDRRFVGVEADPYATAADPTQQRAYVVNATSVSVSVLDTSRTEVAPLPSEPLSRVTPPVFVPVAGSVGRAELRGEVLEDFVLTRTDTWTARWLDGTWRAWVPTANGLAQWVGQADGSYRPSARGVEIDADATDLFDAVDDPWLTALGDAGRIVTWFTDRGGLYAAFTDGSFGAWAFDPAEVVLDGGDDAWRAWIGGPSFTGTGAGTLLYFDARVDELAPSVIGVATTLDGTSFTARDAPVVVAPPGWDSILQPAALRDPNAGAVRLWATVQRAGAAAIVHADSSDGGLTFGEPEVVLELPGLLVGAPVVTWTGGRYRMWLTVGDASGWTHAVSTSVDGLAWTDPVDVAPSDRPPGGRPPRAAIQPVPTESWQLEGSDGTLVTPQPVSGLLWSSTSRGFSLRVASGHDTGTDGRADLRGGLRPGVEVDVSGQRTLYATARDASGRDRLVALRRAFGDRWTVVGSDLVPEGAGGNVDGVRDPVVFRRGDVLVMLYTAASGGVGRLRRAASTDGLAWDPIDGLALPSPPTFESVEQSAHAVTQDSGVLRLHYAGFDGGRWRIGEATSTDGLVWTRRPGPDAPYAFGTGEPGAFDDSAVRDPTVWRDGDTEWMAYAGYDGVTWSIGLASRVAPATSAPPTPWTRRLAPAEGAPLPVLSPVPRTFSALGVASPARTLDGTGVWYAGWDGDAWRIGEARLSDRGGGGQPSLFPAHRVPSAGDSFRFDTVRGRPGRPTVSLAQIVQGVVLPGYPGTLLSEGPTSAVLDAARGLLFVAGKDFPGVLVVDVRDDSTATWADTNALDLEAVLRFDTTTGNLGIQDLLLASDGRLYAAAREPDAVLVIDPTRVVDDAVRDVVDGALVGVIPMRDLTDDAGNETVAAVGASALAEVPGTSLLLVTQMRDNSLAVVDRSLGAYGEEIAHLDQLVEAPVAVRVSPDGRYAVVAGYLGGAGATSEGSELAVVGLDPDGPAYLDVRARIVNR
jgi:DNA-binding beta-propeller fold protein YncE